MNVPVTLYPAEHRNDLQLHMLDSRDRSRVRYQRINADTGEEVPWDQIVKGYEYEEGSYVVIKEEDLDEVAPDASKSVEIEGFVDLADIEAVYFDRPYYLEPGKNGEKAYALLRDTLRETAKAGIAHVVIRTRQYVAALAVRDNALVLYLLRYHQEPRSMDELDLPGSAKDLGVSTKELNMASTLIGSMEMDWEPEAHHDDYRESLMTWIEERIESGEIERTPQANDEDEEPPAPINIMEALKESLELSKPRRSAQ